MLGRCGSTKAKGVAGFKVRPARQPPSRIRRSVFATSCFASGSTWTVIELAPASIKRGHVMIGPLDHQMDVERESRSGHGSSSRFAGPKEMLSTNCPSMMSRCNQSAPAAMTRCNVSREMSKIGRENGRSDNDVRHWAWLCDSERSAQWIGQSCGILAYRNWRSQGDGTSSNPLTRRSPVPRYGFSPVRTCGTAFAF